ncbi:MAG: hypothetical protein M3462_05735 [Chloroflexota bacterium]|nr:hypothetical protein [Chloroflexota bacterium]
MAASFPHPWLPRVIAALALVLLLSAGIPTAAQEGDEILPPNQLTITSTLEVNLTKSVATLPLHRGTFEGVSVWYVITDVSDAALAEELGVNFAPRLANVSNGCPGCVQQVESSDPVLGRGEVAFAGTVDFSPERILVPGPGVGFPPMGGQPGAMAGMGYSPFVRIGPSDIVFHAPIVATGDGPFDVIEHTNTHDRLMGIDSDALTAGLLFVRAFSHGEDIFYLTFDASTPLQAVQERGTFTPVLGQTPFANASDHPDGARSAIFTFTNGQIGPTSPPAQGGGHVIMDGLLAETANLENTPLLEALREGGDAHNVLDSFPTLDDPDLAALYSPLWDLRVGVWSEDAIVAGENVAQTDANAIRQLAADRTVTSPGGVPLGSANIVITCPVLGFADQAPAAPRVAPAVPQGVPPVDDPATS